MQYGLKSLSLAIFCIAFFLLFFKTQHKDAATALYSYEEFIEDWCKIYSDIAQAAYQRNDFETSINACNTVLQRDPSFTKALVLRDRCYQLQHPHDQVQTHVTTKSKKPLFSWGTELFGHHWTDCGNSLQRLWFSCIQKLQQPLQGDWPRLLIPLDGDFLQPPSSTTLTQKYN